MRKKEEAMRACWEDSVTGRRHRGMMENGQKKEIEDQVGRVEKDVR